MINTFVNDVVTGMNGAFHGADTVNMAIFAVAAVLIGMRCSSITHLFSHGLEGLTMTGVIYGLYQVAWPLDSMPETANGWSSRLAGQWDQLMGFSIKDMLGYYVLMLAGLLIVYLVKRLVTRR